MATTPFEPGITVVSYDSAATDDVRGNYWGTARAFVKPDREDSPLTVACEYVCSRLLMAAGIPTPSGEIARDFDGRTVWASMVVELDGQSVAPEDPEAIASREPSTSAGISVFDVWTLNCDRHEENLVSHPSLGLWAIDHEKSLGQIHYYGLGALTGTALDRAVDFHVFRDVPLVEPLVEDWLEVIESISEVAVRSIVTQGGRRGLYDADTERVIGRFLLHRKENPARLFGDSCFVSIEP